MPRAVTQEAERQPRAPGAPRVATPSLVSEPAPSVSAASAGPDIVFTFSFVSWQAAAQRGWFMPEDRLARALVSHERVGRVLVSDLMRSLPVKVVRDRLDRGVADEDVFPASPTTQLLRPVRLRRDYPTSIAGVQRACAAYDRALERRARRMGMRQPALITANPLMAGFAEFAWAGPVTFLATDDWLAYPLHRRWWPAYEESFARLRERGRRVCAVSTAALERIAPTGASAVVPNGLDPAEWSGPQGPMPGRVRDLERPLLVYAGSLGSRLDIPALLGLARELPEATIVLVGPLLEPDHLESLGDAPNVEIRPPLPRNEVAQLIRSADVGVIPHVSSPLTRAMSPLKLYEYVAAGLPVVTADLPPVRDVHPAVTLVEPGGDYVPAVRDALRRGRTDEADRAAFISEHSWHARHEEVLDLVLG